MAWCVERGAWRMVNGEWDAFSSKQEAVEKQPVNIIPFRPTASRERPEGKKEIINMRKK